MSIQINKVKIYKGTQLKVDYTQFSSTGEKDKDAKDTYPHNIHEDMVVAFAVLDEHLTHLTFKHWRRRGFEKLMSSPCTKVS